MKTEGTQNNDELIAAGHELAKCLDSNTPLLDIAKMLSKMATQLGVTAAALREKTKQCDALAAEVYDVKHPGTYLPSKCEPPPPTPSSQSSGRRGWRCSLSSRVHISASRVRMMRRQVIAPERRSSSLPNCVKAVPHEQNTKLWLESS
ncbi:hypothetical protein SMC59_003138 [Cronobacter sakazakii]|nr:hypothetical protein [Cronobacter sakazakii]